MGVPPKTADVIAASEIAGPGKTVTVEFATPPAGEYEFVCTFPGHFAMMKGAFIVEAPAAK
jgi:azurin